MAKKVYSKIILPTFYIFISSILGSSIFQTLQQCVDGATKTQGQQCILLGIVEQGKIPESISFSNEIEIKVGVNFIVLFFSTICFQALSEEERFSLLLEQVDSQGGHLAPDVSVSALAKQTAALVASDLTNLVKKTCLCAVMK